MAKQVFTNNARATLATSITAASTSISLATGKGALFASPSGGDWQLATLTDGTNYEVVKITARSTDTLTVTRGQEGTTARTWAANALIYAGVTKGTLELYRQFDETGNARGSGALDVQTSRGAADQVASGEYAVAVGAWNKASGSRAIAIGAAVAATGDEAIAIGSWFATASGGASIAIGNGAAAAGLYGTGAGLLASASGQSSVALGHSAAASGSSTVAAGLSATASAAGAVAVGNAAISPSIHAVAIGASAETNTSSDNAIAVGYAAWASGDSAIAIGAGASCTHTHTWNITGGNVIRGNSSDYFKLTGVETIYMSTGGIDLKTTADNVWSVTMPSSTHFFPTEIGVIATLADTVTVQPQVAFGVTGTTTALLGSTATTGLTANYSRNIFTPLSYGGVTSITASVKAGATASDMFGRFYIKGILVED